MNSERPAETLDYILRGFLLVILVIAVLALSPWWLPILFMAFGGAR